MQASRRAVGAGHAQCQLAPASEKSAQARLLDRVPSTVKRQRSNAVPPEWAICGHAHLPHVLRGSTGSTFWWHRIGMLFAPSLKPAPINIGHVQPTVACIALPLGSFIHQELEAVHLRSGLYPQGMTVLIDLWLFHKKPLVQSNILMGLGPPHISTYSASRQESGPCHVWKTGWPLAYWAWPLQRCLSLCWSIATSTWSALGSAP